MLKRMTPEQKYARKMRIEKQKKIKSNYARELERRVQGFHQK